MKYAAFYLILFIVACNTGQQSSSHLTSEEIQATAQLLAATLVAENALSFSAREQNTSTPSPSPSFTSTVTPTPTNSPTATSTSTATATFFPLPTPTSSFMVTKVKISWPKGHTLHNPVCDQNVKMLIDITIRVTAPGTVRYEIRPPGASKVKISTETFNSAGDHTISSSFLCCANLPDGDYRVRVVVTKPNTGYSSQEWIHYSCP